MKKSSKSAYASKLATHFLIQTSAWLNYKQVINDTKAVTLLQLENVI